MWILINLLYFISIMEIKKKVNVLFGPVWNNVVLKFSIDVQTNLRPCSIQVIIQIFWETLLHGVKCYIPLEMAEFASCAKQWHCWIFQFSTILFLNYWEGVILNKEAEGEMRKTKNKNWIAPILANLNYTLCSYHLLISHESNLPVEEN